MEGKANQTVRNTAQQDDELIDTLIAVSVVSKRLAERMRAKKNLPCPCRAQECERRCK